MARIHFFLGRGNQSVNQVVGFYAKTFAAGDFDVGAGLVFFAQCVAEFGGAARGERDHLIRKMRVVIGGLVVSEGAQGFDDGVLRLGLTSINDVVDFGDTTEVRMIGFSVLGGNPALVLIRIKIELAIAEIFAQQSKLPHVIGNVFTHVADGAVGADDDFLIVF